MKNIHTATTLLTILSLTLCLSCSPDIEEEEGILIEMGEEGVTVTTKAGGATTVYKEETPGGFPPEPKHAAPDWADNVITLTVGRFETKEEMVAAFGKKEKLEGMSLRSNLHNWVDSPKFRVGRTWEEFRITPPEQAYQVDITLISMQDAGFKKPATIAEVRDRIIEMGYEPITKEETYEIRLQLKDQPSWKETRHRWSVFWSLPPSEEARRMYGGKEVSHEIFNWGRKFGIQPYVYQRLGKEIRNDYLLAPSEEFRGVKGRGEWGDREINPRFACAIPETRRKK